MFRAGWSFVCLATALSVACETQSETQTAGRSGGNAPATAAGVQSPSASAAFEYLSFLGRGDAAQAATRDFKTLHRFSGTYADLPETVRQSKWTAEFVPSFSEVFQRADLGRLFVDSPSITFVETKQTGSQSTYVPPYITYATERVFFGLTYATPDASPLSRPGLVLLKKTGLFVDLARNVFGLPYSVVGIGEIPEMQEFWTKNNHVLGCHVYNWRPSYENPKLDVNCLTANKEQPREAFVRVGDKTSPLVLKNRQYEDWPELSGSLDNAAANGGELKIRIEFTNDEGQHEVFDMAFQPTAFSDSQGSLFYAREPWFSQKWNSKSYFGFPATSVRNSFLSEELGAFRQRGQIYFLEMKHLTSADLAAESARSAAESDRLWRLVAGGVTLAGSQLTNSPPTSRFRMTIAADDAAKRTIVGDNRWGSRSDVDPLPSAPPNVVNGMIQGNAVVLTERVKFINSGQVGTLTYRITFDGDRLVGTWTIPANGSSGILELAVR